VPLVRGPFSVATSPHQRGRSRVRVESSAMSPGPLLMLIAVAIGVVGLVLGLRGVMRWRASAPGKRWRGGALTALGGVLCAVCAMLFWAATQLPYLTLVPICHANLRGIWQAVCMYQEARHEYPASFQDLIREGYSSDKGTGCVFSYPRQSYVYVPGLAPTDPSTWIIAFDPPGCHPRPYRYVLYLSGEVHFMNDAEVEREYERFAAEFQGARGFPPKLIRDSGR
jgi:hypothetical protein